MSGRLKFNIYGNMLNKDESTIVELDNQVLLNDHYGCHNPLQDVVSAPNGEVRK